MDENSRKSTTSYNPDTYQTEDKGSYDSPYIEREPLESHYFDRWTWGWTRLNNRFVVNPDLYGEEIRFTKIHEIIHNLYNTGEEAFVEKMTRYVFRNEYSNY